jgi:aspartyl-tRNA(Asn)/glutamyl-tRNA(Gln) amidotransferase subunit A
MTKKQNSSSVPITYQDATALAELIRTKEVSPVEVMQAHLDRIAEVNPKVNAIVTLMAKDALQQAKVAEQAVMKGDELGVFHGVPFTIKDSLDTAGVVTQRASRLFAGNIPKKDATAVARMKAAGAIPLAKTNLPEFSAWWESDNRVTGATNNPWNLDRTAGGSSGGESGAISSGMSPIGLGSDIGISVRGPAMFTGIVALKATHGRIPYTGHWPIEFARSFHVGPMARSVRDIALALDVLKGPDGIDGYTIASKNAEASFSRLPGTPIRVGWMTDAFSPVDPEVSAAVAATADFLQSVGCTVEQVSLPLLEQNDWVSPAGVLWLTMFLRPLQALAVGRVDELTSYAKAFHDSPAPSMDEIAGAELKIEQLKSVFAGYFEKYDVLLCPIIPFTAPKHGQSEYVVNGVKMPTTHTMRWTVPFNLTGLPALAVSFRFSSEHLPIGVQLVSRWFDEAIILRLGQLIETVSQVHGQHPSI